MGYHATYTAVRPKIIEAIPSDYDLWKAYTWGDDFELHRDLPKFYAGRSSDWFSLWVFSTP